MKRKRINVPIYDHVIELIVFNNIKELQKTRYWNTIKLDFMASAAAMTLDHKGKSQNTLIIPKGRLESLVHELIHVKNYINKRNDLKISDECEAYLIGYLFNKCYKFVK